MKGIRYELYFDGEAQGSGIFAGMSELDLDDDGLERLEKPFRSLSIATTELAGKERCSFWFTEVGERRYFYAIRRIVDAYAERTPFDVERIERAFEDGDVVWSDKDQFAVPVSVVDG